ncbi:hypothetical protein PanWU01x14_011310, partial [Parasponia andersonii]
MRELLEKKYEDGVSDILYGVWSLENEFNFEPLGEGIVAQVREWAEAKVAAATATDLPDPELDEVAQAIGDDEEVATDEQ